MVIDKGATVVFNQPCVFYQENQSLQKKEYNQYPNKLSKATLINNGTLELNSSFGGFVDVNGIDAVVKTEANFSSSISSKEASTFTKFLNKLPEAATTFTITTDAKGPISYNDLQKTERVFFKNTTFTSGNVDTAFVWKAIYEPYITSVTLSKSEFKNETGEATISVSIEPGVSDLDLKTVKWSIKNSSKSDSFPGTDKNAEDPSSNNVLKDSVNGSLQNIFVVKTCPKDAKYGLIYYTVTWTYTIEFTVTCNYGNKTVTLTKDVDIKIKSS